MPLSPRVTVAARPSSLPLPRLSEVMPPPHVPRDLATPSPVRPRHAAAAAAKLHVESAAVRAGSLSPAVTSVSDKIVPERKVSDKTKSSKFVKLLDQNIHNSAALYKQSGISKTNNTSEKQLKESKNISNNINSSNSTRVNNNKNVQNTRKSSANENKPQIKNTRKISDEKVPVGSNRKESIRKTTKDGPGVSAGGPQKPKSSSSTTAKKTPKVAAPAAVPVSGGGAEPPDLVRFTPAAAAQQQTAELDRLETAVADQAAAVARISRSHADTVAGARVMSIVMAHMADKVSLNERLQRTIDQLSNSVDEANLQISLKDEALKVLQLSLEEKSGEFQDLIASLKQEHEDSLESESKKLEKQIEKLKKDAQLEIHEMTIKHEEEVSELLSKHNDEKNRLEQLHTSIHESFKSKMSEQEDRLQSAHLEDKASLTTKVTDLTFQVKTLEENLHNGSDYRVKMAQNKMMNLQQEVDSLKTVLEMKTGEIHELRTDKVKLEEKLELYDQQQLALRKMSAQVEDLRSQLVGKTDLEQKLVEDNRVLHQMVMRVDTEKKRLSMENEQLNWKMSQSFTAANKDFNVLNTPDDAGSALTDCPLSMSYCEGADAAGSASLPPRFTRGGRPVSAPLTQSMFDDSRSSSLCPDSPRVLEIVEKSESVSWKLEYEAALSAASPAPPRRKMSPGSPLALRKCKSAQENCRAGAQLMTQSLDLGLARSNSYAGAGAGQGGEHSPLCRTVSSHALPRSGSVRRKILPPFETLSESTESESDESKRNSPTEAAPARAEVVTPAPVDIGGGSDDEVCCEISSSSEIEIGVEPEPGPGAHEYYLPGPGCRRLEDLSSESPDTEPEVTIRSNIKKTGDEDAALSPDHETDTTLRSELNSGLGRASLASSLNSYDLGRLFAARPGDSRAGGGEALGEDSGGLCAASDPVSSCGSSGSAVEEAAMTDSLATLDWDTDTNDGDDESRD